MRSPRFFFAAGAQSSSVPSAARPANDPGGWIKIADYPADALGAGQSGTVAFKLDVDAAGNVGGKPVKRKVTIGLSVYDVTVR